MREERGPWYLLTGLLLGLGLGLVWAWVIRPVQYVDTTPASLSAEDKDHYRALIAAAYQANGDAVRARARLALLHDPDMYRAVAEQAQRTLAEGQSPDQARALGLLAVALGRTGGPPQEGAAQLDGTLNPTQVFSATVFATAALPPRPNASPTPFATLVYTPTLLPAASPTPSLAPTGAVPSAAPTGSTAQATLAGTPARTPTRTPPYTPTSLPTRTLTPTPGAPFVLKSQEKVCTQKLDQPVVQIEAIDSAGIPVPGVEIIVAWESGEQHFFTGLKPELGLGYADLTLTPGVTYSLRLSEGGQLINTLTAADCSTSGGQRFWGAWRLVFVQP